MFVLVALWQPLSLSLSPCIYASIICARPSGDATCTTDGAAIVAAAPPRITGCPDRGVRATFPQHGVCRTVNVCRVTASVPSARAIGCRNVYGWHAHNFELPERVVIGWRYTGEEFAYPSAIVEIGSYNVMVDTGLFREVGDISRTEGDISRTGGEISRAEGDISRLEGVLMTSETLLITDVFVAIVGGTTSRFATESRLLASSWFVASWRIRAEPSFLTGL